MSIIVINLSCHFAWITTIHMWFHYFICIMYSFVKTLINVFKFLLNSIKVQAHKISVFIFAIYIFIEHHFSMTHSSKNMHLRNNTAQFSEPIFLNTLYIIIICFFPSFLLYCGILTNNVDRKKKIYFVPRIREGHFYLSFSIFFKVI